MTVATLFSRLVAIVVGLAISPVVGLASGVAWFEAGGTNTGGVAGFFVSVAVFVFFVWKTGPIFERAFEWARAKFSEPTASCVLFGVVGALLFGSGMAAGILLLGHTRPAGWDFARIPLWASLGFIVFAVAGFFEGRRRRREKTHGM